MNIKTDPFNLDDIRQAAKRIGGAAIRTPLLKSPLLDEMTGADVYLKPECLQRTGSFKFRGAYNAIAGLDEIERKKGVVAISSGNHAQGVAEAARIFGIAATIVMPADAPKIKIERTQRSGANIIFYDRLNGEDRDVAGQKALDETGGAFIHPYNEPMVIAGQGTAGLEIADDIAALGKAFDRAFVPTGGGGLLAGVSLALTNSFKTIAIHSCEPEHYDDYARSLVSGGFETNSADAPPSICDAIVTPSPGEHSMAICRKRVAEGKSVTDDEALAATAFAFNEMKLAVEPGGAVALAAFLKAGRTYTGECIAVVLSGGNIDPEILQRALKADQTIFKHLKKGT